MFSVEFPPADGQSIIRFSGELDITQVDYAEAQVRPMLTEGASGPIIIDLSELTFCDSSGIRLLLQFEIAAADSGREVLLRQPARIFRRIVEALGLESEFRFVRAGEPAEAERDTA
jgi:anti-sigma B factor antagonist